MGWASSARGRDDTAGRVTDPDVNVRSSTSFGRYQSERGGL
jgi:hypothetical protein